MIQILATSPFKNELTMKNYKLPLLYSIEDYEDVAGLTIFNCSELDERERYTSLTVSWMIQIVQVCMLLPFSFLLLIYIFLGMKTTTNA